MDTAQIRQLAQSVLEAGYEKYRLLNANRVYRNPDTGFLSPINPHPAPNEEDAFPYLLRFGLSPQTGFPTSFSFEDRGSLIFDPNTGSPIARTATTGTMQPFGGDEVFRVTEKREPYPPNSNSCLTDRTVTLFASDETGVSLEDERLVILPEPEPGQASEHTDPISIRRVFRRASYDNRGMLHEINLHVFTSEGDMRRILFEHFKLSEDGTTMHEMPDSKYTPIENVTVYAGTDPDHLILQTEIVNREGTFWNDLDPLIKMRDLVGSIDHFIP